MGFRWISCDFDRFRWISCDFDRFRWISCDFDRFRWISCDFDRFRLLRAVCFPLLSHILNVVYSHRIFTVVVKVERLRSLFTINIMPRKTSYMTVVYSRRIFTVVIKGERLWSLFTINVIHPKTSYTTAGNGHCQINKFFNLATLNCGTIELLECVKNEITVCGLIIIFQKSGPQEKANQMKRFQLEFDQIRSVKQTIIASNSETFQRVGKKFPSVVEYNNQNLLSIYNAGDHGRYARRIMKILFTLEKMSQSILYANPTYAKPGLNSRRIIIF
ncbi:unnamed protein product [Rotaria magnacalcarata]